MLILRHDPAYTPAPFHVVKLLPDGSYLFVSYGTDRTTAVSKARRQYPDQMIKEGRPNA